MGKFITEVSLIGAYGQRQELYQKAIQFIGCPCTNKEARCRPKLNGGYHWTIQCMDCGLVHGDKDPRGMMWVKKSHPLVMQAADYIEIDDDLRQTTKKQARFIASFMYQNELRVDKEYVLQEWEDYKAFLSTGEWEQLRRRVFNRDRELCQLEHYGCTKLATIVHHKTYVRWRDQLLIDLVSCCRPCHEWEHPHLRRGW